MNTAAARETFVPRRRLRVMGDLPGPRSRDLRIREGARLAPGSQAIATYAGVAIASGMGSELIDVEGNCFLDLSAAIGVASIGYGHPKYEAALAAQLGAVHAGSFTT